MLGIVSAACLLAQEQAALDAPTREQLRSSAWLYGYPRGMFQHTAMFHTITTRYQLLKAATDCKELSSFLNLSEKQLETVRQLDVVSEQVWHEINTGDENAQPDEQFVDPKYFDFLQADQLERLDFVAFWFDGYASLLHSSVAARLNLQPETRQRIAEAITNIRNEVVLPNSWSRFAGPQPNDGDYMDCYFAGAVCAQLNVQIIEILSDAECSRLDEWLRARFDTKEFGEAIAAIRKRAILPGGVLSLSDFKIKDRPDNQNSWPADAQGLIEHLNDWDIDELTAYNEPRQSSNRIASGETIAWIHAHKKELLQLGILIKWDPQQKKYVESVAR